MQKNSLLLFLGFLVFVTPFLGIPKSWESILLFTLGVAIMLLTLLIRFASRRESRSGRDNDFFTESEPATHTISKPH